jgi:Tfp pilus assembly protein PilP
MLMIRANLREAGLKLLILAATLVLAGACRPGNKTPSQVLPAPVKPQPGQAGVRVDLPPAGDTLFKSEAYEYPLKGNRDPFKSVVQKRGEGSGENTVGTLDISNITLTGIIEGPNGRLALIHDNQGVGYVVQEGDQLIGGRVVAIKDTIIVFRQDVERGKTIEFSLPLLRENQDLRIN